MNPLPIVYLHLETGIFPIFLAMVLLMQLARASEPGHYTQSGQRQLLLLVGGFILLTVLFGALLYNMSPLLAVELAAGVILSLMHPANALCFFVHLLYLRPWEIATTNPLLLALPRGLAMLCFLAWLIHPGLHGKPSPPAHKALILLLAFSAWLFLTTFMTPDIADTQSDWFSVYFKSLVVFVMCLFFIDSERSVSEFQLTIVISALALMVVRLYQYHVEGPDLVRLQSSGTIGDSNDLAAVVVMALPFALLPVFRKSVGLGQQIMGVLFSGLSILVIWLSQSRGAMLALAAQVLMTQVLRAARIKWLSILLMGGVLAVGYTVALRAIPRDSEDMEASQQGRIGYWKAAIGMTVHHPIFGVGYGEFPANVDEHMTAHSSWFLAFAESGIPGGLLFISFFVTVLRTAWHNRLQRPAQLYALVGYGVAMSFLSHTYLMDVYLLAGLVMSSDSLRNMVPDVL